MAEGANDNEKGFAKVDAIAQLFGVSVRRIQQLTQDGVIQTTQTSQGRRYETIPTIQKYIQYLSDKAYGKSKSEAEANLREQKLRAEVALKESQGELHRLRTEIAAGKYISVEEVKLDYSRFFVVLKKFVMGIPNKMAGRMSGYADPVEIRQLEKELQAEANKLLKNFVLSATIEDGKAQ